MEKKHNSEAVAEAYGAHAGLRRSIDDCRMLIEDAQCLLRVAYKHLERKREQE